MRSVGVVPWLLFALWCAWLVALQGLCAGSPAWGRWVPDVGLVLLFAYDARPTRSPRPARSGAKRAALLVACGRIAFSADPPLAILAAYLAAAWAIVALRDVLEVDRALPRALLAGVAAGLLTLFWSGCRALSLASAGEYAPPLPPAWPTALSTAVAALVLLPALARLPGLSPLTVGGAGARSAP